MKKNRQDLMRCEGLHSCEVSSQECVRKVLMVLLLKKFIVISHCVMKSSNRCDIVIVNAENVYNWAEEKC